MRVQIINIRDVKACPELRLDAAHYRADGSCYHVPDKQDNVDRAL